MYVINVDLGKSIIVSQRRMVPTYLSMLPSLQDEERINDRMLRRYSILIVLHLNFCDVKYEKCNRRDMYKQATE